MENLHSINKDQKVYVLKCGTGYSCYGFEVVYNLSVKLAKELNEPAPPAETGTEEAYSYFLQLQKYALQRHQVNGWRSAADLTPQLIGLEGKRVEVVDQEGKKYRFNVGRSTGFIPCHLEVHNRRSSGGPGARKEYKTVRVIA